MSRKATPIHLTPRQRQVLESMSRSRTSCHHLVIRAKVILLADEGLDNATIGARVGLENHCVGKWRARWEAAVQRLSAADQEGSAKELSSLIKQTLRDAPRPGTPITFTAEQVTQIIALACEDAAESGRAITHWTAAELADEAIKRSIVESISPRQVARFLKYGRPETAPEPLLAES